MPAWFLSDAIGAVMSNDLFQSYARTFEARRETEMSLKDYLQACRKDPMMHAGAAERLLEAIGEPEVIDTAKDVRLGRIFMEDTIERIVSFLRHAAQGLEERKQILYLLGPVGGGKSSLAERIKALIENQPIYVLKAGDQLSPVFESPLGLFDSGIHGAELEERYGIPRRRLTGLMSPWAVKRRVEEVGYIRMFRGGWVTRSGAARTAGAWGAAPGARGSWW